MSGISSDVFFAVTKIKTTFANEIGESHSGVGTGFWISDTTNNENIFVTNKHNLDYNFLRDVSGFDLKKVEIEFRKSREDKEESGCRYLEGVPEFFEVSNVADSLEEHTDADCAIFYNPTFLNKSDDYRLVHWVKFEEIADQIFFLEKSAPLDNVSFIGFPGKNWEDRLMKLPIARSAVIASLPHISITNDSIKTTDVTLVSGFSFGGSSGSPVILNQKSLKVTPPLKNPDYVPPQLIGIMSGHWNDAENKDEHKGISYYTRSTALLSLIKNARIPIIHET